MIIAEEQYEQKLKNFVGHKVIFILIINLDQIAGQIAEKCKENQRIYLNNQIINLISNVQMSEEPLQRIKNRIKQLGHPQQIEQLCLDGIQFDNFSQSICQQLVKCNNVLYLTLNHCKISTLQHFPVFPSLLALELIGNCISTDQFVHLNHCQKIQHLALDQNQIRKVQHLNSLNNLPEIQHLEIRGNPICNQIDYRAKIFEAIPNLKIVDSQDVFGDEDVMFGTDTDSEGSQLDSNEEEEHNANQYEDQEEESEGQYQKRGHKRKNY